MTPQAESPPPPPSKPQWHRFANNVIAGNNLVESYLQAGFTCSRASAYVIASRLRRKPEVDAYIQYWLNREDEQRLLALREKLGDG